MHTENQPRIINAEMAAPSPSDTEVQENIFELTPNEKSVILKHYGQNAAHDDYYNLLRVRFAL
jgi:hypothetical protein